MDILLQDYLFSHPFFYSLALTLLHFLWQGGFIALSLKLSLILTSHNKPQIRYLLSSVAMLACLIVPIITFFIVHQPGIETISNSNQLLTLLSSANGTSPNANAFNIASDLLPYISITWLAIVLFLASKLIVEIYLVNQLPNQATTPAPEQLNNRFKQLVSKMKLTRTPKLLISLTVDVPMAIGWLKPVVLVPASMLSGLTAEQLEMLILHELAHIRRHDYLVNFLQTLIDILLFFHPAVGWISKQMRNEREYCSDDIAVQHCGNAIAYAHTLADTAALCSKHRHETIPAMAMAASGGDLKNRVVRLVDHHCTPSNDVGKWFAAISILVVIVSLSAQQMLMPNLFEVVQQTMNPAVIESKESPNKPLAESSLAVQLLANTPKNTDVVKPKINVAETNALELKKPSSEAFIEQHVAIKSQPEIILPAEFKPENNNVAAINEMTNGALSINKGTINEEVINELAINEVINPAITLDDTAQLSTLPVIEKAPETNTHQLVPSQLTAQNQQPVNVEAFEAKLENKKEDSIVEPKVNVRKESRAAKTAEIILASINKNIMFDDSTNNLASTTRLTKANLTSEISTQTELFNTVSQLSDESPASLSEADSLSNTAFVSQSNAYIASNNSSNLNNINLVQLKVEETKEVFVPQEEKAELIYAVDPKYPTTAKRKGLELEVQVYFTIDKNGEIKDIEFEKLSKINYFRSSIRNAMKQWTFQPATVDGRPVESQMTKIFSFSLSS